jgi:hypothetical protein
MLSFLRKSQRISQNTASPAGSFGLFRSIADHHCTGYSAIIRDRGDLAAKSEQQGCAEKRPHSPHDRNFMPLAVSAFRTKHQHPALFLDTIIAAPE